MATTTPNYGWPVPTSTDFVKDGATAIEALGDAIDATVFGLPPAGKILQVVSTTKTDTFSASIASGAISGDVTGLTVAITPTSTSNKVLLSGSVSLGNGDLSNSHGMAFLVYRDGSLLTGVSASAGTNTTSYDAIPAAQGITLPFEFLDSPSSVSSVTYSIRLRHTSGATKTMFVNRFGGDSMRAASTITVLEVSA